MPLIDPFDTFFMYRFKFSNPIEDEERPMNSVKSNKLKKSDV
jgi:hypothetical protein